METVQGRIERERFGPHLSGLIGCPWRALPTAEPDWNSGPIRGDVFSRGQCLLFSRIGRAAARVPIRLVRLASS